MSKYQVELLKHLSLLVSHARSNTAKFTSSGGMKQAEEVKINKAQDELMKLIDEHKQS